MKFFVCVETYRHKNIGTLMRCSLAFGAENVIIVGSPKFSTHGAHEAKKHISVIHFYYWKECIEYLRSQGCTSIYGISPRAINYDRQEFGDPSAGNGAANLVPSIAAGKATFLDHPSSAFIIAERDCLSFEQISICDTVLHVSFPCEAYSDHVHYDAKTAICLHQFASTFASDACKREGEKFCLPVNDDIYLKAKKMTSLSLSAAKRRDMNILETSGTSVNSRNAPGDSDLAGQDPEEGVFRLFEEEGDS
jgi:hypothetical protein